MKTFVLTFFLAACFLQGKAQSIVSGTVRDAKDRPVAGANISLEGAYDGTTSGENGNFLFTTAETDSLVILVSAAGFTPWRKTVSPGRDSIRLGVVLQKAVNELETVIITAGTFVASDEKRGAELTAMDIVTTAGADGGIIGAFKTLPGTQQVGESSGLFVRGGTGKETQQFIDGMIVSNPYFSDVPNLAQRNRFNPFLFKGTVFSSGGYSALYGQGLSGALILESVDLPQQSSAFLGLSSVGADAGYEHLFNSGKASLGGTYSYVNLQPYYAVVPQDRGFEKGPELHNGDLNFRLKTSETGMLKFYTNLSTSRIGLSDPDIDSAALTQDFNLDNRYLYTNLNYREYLSDDWKLTAGISFSTNDNDIDRALHNSTGEPVTLSRPPFDGGNFNAGNRSDLTQGRLVMERFLSGQNAIRFGGEYLYGHEKSRFSNTEDQFNDNFDEHFKALFAEADIYLSARIAARIGARFEHSSLLGKANIAPRASLAYQFADKGQLSAAYGIYYQKPEPEYLFRMTQAGDREPFADYARASHYILNYQKISNYRILRIEAFYKEYDQLLKTAPALSSSGEGYARGIELFWRDRGTIPNLDYWLSYSYLDTEREYLNYPRSIQPDFTTPHTASLVVKKTIPAWQTTFGATYSFATGRPYYDIRENAAGDPAVFDQGETINYNSLGLSFSHLTSLFKKDISVIVLGINNILGTDQVYGYDYNYDGSRKAAITPPAKRFFFLGLFMSFGVDRTDDFIDSTIN